MKEIKINEEEIKLIKFMMKLIHYYKWNGKFNHKIEDLIQEWYKNEGNLMVKIMRFEKKLNKNNDELKCK